MSKPKIRRSVGKGGKNRPIDVAVIQSLFCAYHEKLLKEIPKDDKVVLKKPTVNGICDGDLEKEILAFQKYVRKMKIPPPDSLIEAGKKTFNKLVELVPEKKGNLRSVIFGSAVSHANVLSKVKLKKFEDFFSKHFKRTRSNGLENVVKSIKNDSDITDVRWAAYMLATVFHEISYSFKPVEEAGKGSGHRNRYGKKIKVKDKNGKEHTNVYYGRGYVQLTWDYNYKEMGKRLNMGDELYINPDKVLEHDIAYKIMSYGMRLGSFTARKLLDYISGAKCNYVKARQIINGLDRAPKIAEYAKKIEILLRLAAM